MTVMLCTFVTWRMLLERLLSEMGGKRMEAETGVRLSTFIEVEERVLAGDREQG